MTATIGALFAGYGGLEDQHYIFRVGKKAAGRELDGRTWDEYPTMTR